MHKYVIIAAGGTGTRMHSDIPKQFMLLNGKPLLCHTIEKFIQAYSDVQIIIAAPADFIQHTQALLEQYQLTTNVTIIEGGATRYHSVQNGVRQITVTDAIVFVHDAARCLVSVDLIHRCYKAAIENGNAIPAINVTDSIRMVNGTENYALDRSAIKAIQTPQTFVADSLQKAFTQAYTTSFTDEASVVEALGIAIHLVEGESSNIKVTNPIDLRVATLLSTP